MFGNGARNESEAQERSMLKALTVSLWRGRGVCTKSNRQDHNEQRHTKFGAKTRLLNGMRGLFYQHPHCKVRRVGK